MINLSFFKKGGSRTKVRFYLTFVTIMLFWVACSKDKSTSPSWKPAYTEVSAIDQVQNMGRGVNLGNALEAPNEGDWGMTLQSEYFQVVAAAGFDNVRIPITWATHTKEIPPYTVEPSFFKRIDWVIEQSLRNGLIVIINHHHFDELDENPESIILNSPRNIFLGIWKQIAERYQDMPNSVVFEINNEPHNNFTANVWDDLWKETLAIIRETNPTRNVIVGPIDWNSIYSLNTLNMPSLEEDAHLIVTFHYYNPFQFTHQCASWAGDEACNWKGTTWGTSAEYTKITNDFETAARWAFAQGRPLYLGEFGAYQEADTQSRVRWMSHMARTAEAKGMAWSYWEFGAGFGLYDRGKHEWRTALLNALIPAE